MMTPNLSTLETSVEMRKNNCIKLLPGKIHGLLNETVMSRVLVARKQVNLYIHGCNGRRTLKLHRTMRNGPNALSLLRSFPP